MMSADPLPPLPPVPEDEEARLVRLQALQILASEPEPLFDRLVQLAAQACGVPIALLSLVDADRQWFKAKVGLPGVQETPRAHAFCAHAIGSDQLFEVADATADDRFSRNPLVVGPPDIRFYAGAPLSVGEGSAVGTLCVIDRTPRQMTDEQRRTLRMLADIASQALDMRRSLVERTLAQARRHAAELAATEARFRALVEQQSEIVSLARPSGELVYVNAAYARHQGASAAALVGTQLLDIVPEGERATVRRQLDQVLNTRQRCTADTTLVAPGGQARRFSWTHAVQRDEQGGLLLHSVGRDIHERVMAEAALREKESFLDRTGRVAGVGGWQFDPAVGQITWSAQTRRIHEVPDDYQPQLDTAIGFYAPESRPLVERAVQQALADGTPWDLELPLVTATGRRIWVRAVGEVEYQDGAVARLVGAFQDITERRLLQERLAANERFLRKLTDSLPVRIAYVDASGRYRFLNDAHCRRFGIPREQALGRTLAELRGEPSPEVEVAFDAAFEGRMQRFEFDDLVQGHRRRIEGQLIPDIDERGAVVGVFKTGVDITERSQMEQALRDLTAIVERSGDFVVQADRRGMLTYLNPAAREVLALPGTPPHAPTHFTDWMPPATRALFTDTVLPAVHQRGSWVGDTTVLAAGGRQVPVSHLVIAHHDAQGRIARYSAVMRDESAKLEARKVLLQHSATLRSVAEAIPACIAVVGTDGCYRFVNTSYERWIGMPREAIVGWPVEVLLGEADHARAQPWIARVLAGERVTWERDYHQGGVATHFSVSYVPLWQEGGSIDGFVAVLQDITDHRLEQARLAHLSERDALTGLFNRAGFDRQLADLGAVDEGRQAALLYIDLDHFKPVNDRYGHPAGDELLQRFGQALAGLVRPHDVTARLGGDEFAILLRNIPDASVAERVAASVVAAAGQPFRVGGHEVHIGATVGVAVSGRGDAAQTLVGRADAALYEAKRSGRGRLCMAPASGAVPALA